MRPWDQLEGGVEDGEHAGAAGVRPVERGPKAPPRRLEIADGDPDVAGDVEPGAAEVQAGAQRSVGLTIHRVLAQ